uniref:Late endosomal/lysosomal adaptor and MAPK and MTOR activator 4 n=1 Tax=Panagrolaimus sp. PS1159 TaxID=55785 RepID=A0AC35FEG9_9BILA
MSKNEIPSLLANIPDIRGSMVIQDGAVISKSGEMTNSDSLAANFIKLVNVGVSEQIIPGEPFQTININYIDECTYTVAVAGKKIYIVKRSPLNRDESDDTASPVTTFPTTNASVAQ